MYITLYEYIYIYIFNKYTERIVDSNSLNELTFYIEQDFSLLDAKWGKGLHYVSTLKQKNCNLTTNFNAIYVITIFGATLTTKLLNNINNNI